MTEETTPVAPQRFRDTRRSIPRTTDDLGWLLTVTIPGLWLAIPGGKPLGGQGVRTYTGVVDTFCFRVRSFTAPVVFGSQRKLVTQVVLPAPIPRILREHYPCFLPKPVLADSETLGR